MTNSAHSRIAVSAAKGLIFAVLILPLGVASVPALANGIQMLPPVTEATKTNTIATTNSVPTPCPAVGNPPAPNILTWDGTNPISCATGVTVTGGNVGIGTTIPQATLDVNGTVNIGSSATLGGALGLANGSGLVGTGCSTVGAIQYDSTTDSPVYCKSASRTWNQVSGCQWLTAPSSSRPESPIPSGVCRFHNPEIGGALVYGTIFSNLQAYNNTYVGWSCFVDVSNAVGGSWQDGDGSACLDTPAAAAAGTACTNLNDGGSFEYYACGE